MFPGLTFEQPPPPVTIHFARPPQSYLILLHHEKVKWMLIVIKILLGGGQAHTSPISPYAGAAFEQPTLVLHASRLTSTTVNMSVVSSSSFIFSTC